MLRSAPWQLRAKGERGNRAVDVAMDVEPGFPCMSCGADVQVFYSSKTGERIGWTCPICRARGFFLHMDLKDRAMLIEA